MRAPAVAEACPSLYCMIFCVQSSQRSRFNYEAMLYNNRKEMPDDRIVIDSEVAHGKPVIKGTRVPVEIILGSLAGGMDIKEVADEYCLEREDILAAIGYAAKI